MGLLALIGFPLTSTGAKCRRATAHGPPHGTGGRQLQMSVDTDYPNNFFVDFSAVYKYFCKILVANERSHSGHHNFSEEKSDSAI